MRKTRPMRPVSRQFSATAKWLHWLAAFFILSIIAVGLQFPFLPLEAKQSQFPTHASIGLIVVAITLARLAWRAAVRPPETPESTPALMSRGAKIGHRLLYALVLYQGALGVWIAALQPSDIRFFNTWNISALAPANPELIDAIRPFHLAGAIALALVIFVHICAALYHHFALRDDTLVRMLPFGGLWQRLTEPQRKQQLRFPSTYLKNWPKRIRHEELG